MKKNKTIIITIIGCWRGDEKHKSKVKKVYFLLLQLRQDTRHDMKEKKTLKTQTHRIFVSFSNSHRRCSISSLLKIRGTIWSFFFGWCDVDSRWWCLVERFWSRQSLLPLGLSLQSLFLRSNDIFLVCTTISAYIKLQNKRPSSRSV